MEPAQQPPPSLEPTPNANYVPWNLRETWVGLGLFALIMAAFITLFYFLPALETLGMWSLVFFELSFLLPVVVTLAWKRASLEHLGYRSFTGASMGLGCGSLLAVYPLVIIHNLALYLLGIETQSDSISGILSNLDSPALFIFSAVVLAPLVEETFFRGFLFTGLRQRFGWVPAMLISSLIFGVAHMQPVAFIPTFLLGCALAFAYQRSNSIWPGIIIHFLINGLASLALWFVTQMGLM